MRKWSFEQTAKGTEVEIKLDRAQFDGLRFTVREYIYADIDHIYSFDVRSEIQGSDCAYLVCCIDNARRRRGLWCPTHNVSLFVFTFGSLSRSHRGVISCKQRSSLSWSPF